MKKKPDLWTLIFLAVIAGFAYLVVSVKVPWLP